LAKYRPHLSFVRHRIGRLDAIARARPLIRQVAARLPFAVERRFACCGSTTPGAVAPGGADIGIVLCLAVRDELVMESAAKPLHKLLRQTYRVRLSDITDVRAIYPMVIHHFGYSVVGVPIKVRHGPKSSLSPSILKHLKRARRHR